MTVLSTIDILDEPDALADGERVPYCEHCDGNGCDRCDLDYDPSPLCNCGTCPDGGPFTCVRED